MWTHTLTPRFNDTDALGHINNISLVAWLESARAPVFRIFIPDLNPKNWQLIIARLEVDYKKPAFYGVEALVQTTVEKIGNSSFCLNQCIVQKGQDIVNAKVVMVRYDYQKECTMPLDQEHRQQLAEHLL